ncbi:hypothetical protein NIES267_73130 (plasmid) [Calothrix parasitica NIES-267]|uniref:HTH cro/C1-type domain-containing protein n=1 Tax=Calothrix parasitica NIES-267 TaxID=1973488 RepID=A0A1Z4M2T0_9CYAN|nr:hypothetical protein NIES267_73130 [Calothrix parasitica NIES-267]
MSEIPLERLIKKYGQTRYSIAKKMAEIKLEGFEGNTEDEDYKEKLKKKTKNYQSSFSRYESDGIKPKIATLSLISKAIGCNREELESIFHSQDYPLIEDNDNDSELLGQGYEFKCLEVYSTAKYYESNYLEWSKSYVIECLRDNLKIIEKLDFYECDGEPVTVSSQDDFFQIAKNWNSNCRNNYVSVIFEEPLKEGEKKEFTLNYSCSKLYEGDNTFGATWVLHPTDLLKIDFAPPNPKKCNMQAKLYEYEDRGSFLDGRRTELGSVFLDNKSLSFKKEIQKPPLGALYKVYWG